jgi:hypothetical protein
VYLGSCGHLNVQTTAAGCIFLHGHNALMPRYARHDLSKIEQTWERPNYPAKSWKVDDIDARPLPKIIRGTTIAAIHRNMLTYLYSSFIVISMFPSIHRGCLKMGQNRGKPTWHLDDGANNS